MSRKVICPPEIEKLVKNRKQEDLVCRYIKAVNGWNKMTKNPHQYHFKDVKNMVEKIQRMRNEFRMLDPRNVFIPTFDIVLPIVMPAHPSITEAKIKQAESPKIEEARGTPYIPQDK